MKDITIFTRTNCPYCLLVKKFLDMKQIQYKTINMEENPEAMEKVMSMTGRTIAPTTLVTQPGGEDTVIVGYNLGQLSSALQ